MSEFQAPTAKPAISAYRILAALLALFAWAGIVMKLIGNVQLGEPFWIGAWKSAGYYTFLINLSVAIMATGIVMGWRWLNRPALQLTLVNAILVVGIIYSLLLRAIHHPEGLDILTTHVQHDIVPPLALLVWLIGPHGGLRWPHVFFTMIPGAAYLVYILIRAPFDGYYPYPFMDPAKHSFMELVISNAVQLVTFSILALCLIGFDKYVARRARATVAA